MYVRHGRQWQGCENNDATGSEVKRTYSFPLQQGVQPSTGQLLCDLERTIHSGTSHLLLMSLPLRTKVSAAHWLCFLDLVVE